MEYIQVDEYSRLYEFDPNIEYQNANSIEGKMFHAFIEQYGWELFKNKKYNSGQHHIYVIINYQKDKPRWVGFIHILECDKISKKSIQEIHFVKEELFNKKVVFIHTIRVELGFRRKKYASYLVNVVKRNFLSKADLMVEATKKGKKFWPAVGFIDVKRTPKGRFMICPKGIE